jgi:hypothetical protein
LSPESCEEELPAYFADPAPDADGPSLWALWREALDEHAAHHPTPALSTPVDPGVFAPGRSVPVTFLRALDVPFVSCVAAIDEWWRQEASRERLDVGRSGLRGPPALDADGGQLRLPAGLGRVLPHTIVRMDLELFPWLGDFGTKLCLRPRRAVHANHRYFVTGHAFLDAVVAAIARYLPDRASGAT